MGYLFGIILCITFMYTLHWRHMTRGEREARRREREEKLQNEADDESKRILTGKTCSNGWHTFDRWSDSYDGYLQYRRCTKCGIKDTRVGV